MALGDYVKTTFVEGSAPGISAARLNNNEDKTAELDQALLTTQTDFNAHLAEIAQYKLNVANTVSMGGMI